MIDCSLAGVVVYPLRDRQQLARAESSAPVNTGFSFYGTSFSGRVGALTRCR